MILFTPDELADLMARIDSKSDDPSNAFTTVELLLLASHLCTSGLEDVVSDWYKSVIATAKEEGVLSSDGTLTLSIYTLMLITETYTDTFRKM